MFVQAYAYTKSVAGMLGCTGFAVSLLLLS